MENEPAYIASVNRMIHPKIKGMSLYTPERFTGWRIQCRIRCPVTKRTFTKRFRLGQDAEAEKWLLDFQAAIEDTIKINIAALN